nr:germinal-center associated nuclear protein isoform X2 [Ciona intestinalis]|eukprot:XP_002130399.1 germinal-center associated nuclear protein isoform X2 [Ciona intestinalis]
MEQNDEQSRKTQHPMPGLFSFQPNIQKTQETGFGSHIQQGSFTQTLVPSNPSRSDQHTGGILQPGFFNPSPSGATTFGNFPTRFGISQSIPSSSTSDPSNRNVFKRQTGPVGLFQTKTPNFPNTMSSTAGFPSPTHNFPPTSSQSNADHFQAKPVFQNLPVAQAIDQSKAVKRKSDTAENIFSVRRKRSIDSDSSSAVTAADNTRAIKSPLKRTSHKGLFQTLSQKPNEEMQPSSTETKKPLNKISPRSLKAKQPARILGGLRRKSSSGVIENAITNQLVCTGIPRESNDKDQLRRHFSRFGNVIRVQTNVNKNSASVKFSTNEEAAKAKMKGKNLFGKAIHIYFGTKSRQSTEDAEDTKKKTTEKVVKKFPSTQKPRLNPQQGTTGHRVTTIAKTDTEKLTVLERIDKILRTRLVKESDLSKAIVTIGTCPDMCPEKERYLRQHRNLLASYETEPGTKKIDHRLAVKEYSRSSADQEEALSHELRPTKVLRLTMDYLLTHIIDSIDRDRIADWYDFLWNRTRAMRKEISIQQSNDVYAVQVTEECARFHICCAHELCEEDRHNFDPKINNENLEKTMKTVLDMYTDVNYDQQDILPGFENNEPEFRAYHILLNINRTSDVLRELQNMKAGTRSSPSVQIAVAAFSSVHSNNYARFFNVVKKSTYLQAAILHRYFTQVRKQAILTMARAYTTAKGSTWVPMEDVMRTLCFSSENELNAFCTELMIATKPGFIELSRSENCEVDVAMSVFRSHLVSSKMSGRSLGIIIAHGRTPCPNVHHPESSFDEEGRYIGKHAALLDTVDTFEPQKENIETTQQSIPQTQGLPAGVLTNMVKLIAKSLFHEVIDEMVLDVSIEVVKARDLVKASTEITDVVLRNDVDAEIRILCSEVLQEEKVRQQQKIKMAQQEQERALRRAAEEEMRRREEEKRKREQLERKMRERKLKEEKEVFLREYSMELATQMEETIVSQQIHEISKHEHREARLDKLSTLATHQILEDIIQEESFNSVKEVLRSERITCHTTLHKIVEKTTLKNSFNKWRNMLSDLQKRRYARMKFPAAPAMRAVQLQVHEFLPTPVQNHSLPRRNSFSIEGKREFPLSMDPLPQLYDSHAKMSKDLKSRAGSFCETQKRAFTEKLPVLDMLWDAMHDKLDTEATHLYWKIGILSHNSDHTWLAWLKQKFGFPQTEDTEVKLFNRYSFGETRRQISACCQVIFNSTPEVNLCRSNILFVMITHPNCFPYLKNHLNRVCEDKGTTTVIVVNCDTGLSEREILHELGLSDDCKYEFHLLSFHQMDYIANEIELKRGITLVSHSEPTLWVCESLRCVLEHQISILYIKPVMRHCTQREQLYLPTLEPHQLVDIYNHAIQSTCDVLTHPDLHNLAWPSPAMDTGITDTEVPCKGWNTADGFEKLRNICDQLQLPSFPVFDKYATEQEIYEKVFNYCQTACPKNDTLTASVAATVKLYQHQYAYDYQLDLTTAEVRTFVEQFPWPRIVDAVASSKLQEILYVEKEQVVCYNPYKLSLTSLTQSMQATLDEVEFDALGLDLINPTVNSNSECQYDTLHSQTMGPAKNLTTILSKNATMQSNASATPWLADGKSYEAQTLKKEVEQEKILSQRFEERLKKLLEEGGNTSMEYFDSLL